MERATKRFVVGRKKKSVVAVNEVTLSIRRGEIYGILGANGSGKSTLIRLVSTLLTLDGGRVEVFGNDVERDEMKVKQLINRVSVDAAFFKKLSPHENLAYAARLYGLDAKKARAEAIQIMARLGIGEKRLEPAARADEPRDAAEGRDRASAADEPDGAAARRADDGSRPAVEARRADLHRGGARHARRDDRADDARPRRGGAAVRSDRADQRRSDGRRGDAGGADGAWSPGTTARSRRWRACS